MTSSRSKKSYSVHRRNIRNSPLYGHAFMFLDKIVGHKIEKRRFRKLRGYDLNLDSPTSFSEKVVWKKLYDRNPLLTITADKYQVRTYLKQKLGRGEAEKILIPLLFVTDNPEEIPFGNLPEKYIIKANHGSHWNIVVDGMEINRKKIISNCKKWLKQRYGLAKNEWAYKNIEPKIIIEELLIDEKGKIPKDYKFFVFHGVCRKIMVFSDRFSERGKKVLSYDRDWNCTTLPITRRSRTAIKKPETYQEMLNLAEKLGKDFDFVRVDLYTVNKKVFFGELTHYPMSGSSLPAPRENDIELGKFWDLERNKHWKDR